MGEWGNQEAFIREIRVSLIGRRGCVPNEIYILRELMYMLILCLCAF